MSSMAILKMYVLGSGISYRMSISRRGMDSGDCHKYLHVDIYFLLRTTIRYVSSMSVHIQ